MARKNLRPEEYLEQVLPNLPAKEIVNIIKGSGEWQQALAELKGERKFPEDPVKFMREILELEVTPKQEEIVRAVIDHKWVVVSSGHAVGKSLITAAIACYWLVTHDDSIVVTLAPTWNQVTNVIWRYIRSFVRKYNLPGEVFETPRWNMGDAKHYAVGMSPRKATQEDMASLQGFHSPKLLVLMDEAAGLPKVLWQGVTVSLATSEGNRVVAIGNPITQSGPFWAALNSLSWHSIYASCLDHPNVTKGKEVIPGAVSRDWVEAMIRDHTQPVSENTPGSIFVEWWDNNKGGWFIPDPVFKARVIGVAPGENESQLISMEWINDAKYLDPEPLGELILAVDPARGGGDFACMVARQGGKVHWIRRRKPVTQNPGMEIADWIRTEYNTFGATKVIVEEAGLGASVVDIARQMGLPVIGIYPQSAASNRRRFMNLRAEMYWRIREAIRLQHMSLPDDDLLDGDLLSVEYKFDNHGRIQIESKEDIIKKIGRSPDSGDALALSFALPAGMNFGDTGMALAQMVESGGSFSRWHTGAGSERFTKTNRWKPYRSVRPRRR